MKNIKISKIIIITVIVIVVSILTSIGIDFYNESTNIKVIGDGYEKIISERVDAQYDNIKTAFDKLGTYNFDSFEFILNEEYNSNDYLVQKNEVLTKLYELVIESGEEGSRSAIIRLYEENNDTISCVHGTVTLIICKAGEGNLESYYGDIFKVLSLMISDDEENYITILTENMPYPMLDNYIEGKSDALFNINGKDQIRQAYINGLSFHLTILDTIVYYFGEIEKETDIELIEHIYFGTN